MSYRLIILSFTLLLVGCISDSGEPERQTPSQSQPSISDSLSQNLQYASSRVDSSMGQTIYVPVYSHIYQQNQKATFNLTATLSFRNADLDESLTLTKVLYYDSEGNLVKSFLDSVMTIKPLASTSFVIEEDDLSGGVGANFIVRWNAENSLFPPVVEAVMISTSQQQGISFVSHGRVLEENIGSPEN